MLTRPFPFPIDSAVHVRGARRVLRHPAHILGRRQVRRTARASIGARPPPLDLPTRITNRAHSHLSRRPSRRTDRPVSHRPTPVGRRDPRGHRGGSPRHEHRAKTRRADDGRRVWPGAHGFRSRRRG